jgi:hypothetical protein
MQWVKAHAKTLTALAGIVVGGAVEIFGTSNRYVELAVAVATVLGVYGVPNRPAARAGEHK